MTSGQEWAVLRRYVKQVRQHLVGVVSSHASERAPLERLIEAWEGDLRKGLSERTRLSLEELAGAIAKDRNLERKTANLGNLRAYISRARKAVSQEPLTVGGYRFTFKIFSKAYGLDVTCETQENKNLLKFWEPYLDSPQDTAIALVERLFFQLAPDVYIRNVRVNNVEDYVKCPILKKNIKTPHPSNLYVSTGEAAAAFRMLDTFTNNLKIAAKGLLFSPGVRYQNNLVVMGSGTEEPRFDPPERFRYRITRDGISNKQGKITFPDRWGRQDLTIHVLVSRWKNDEGYVVTTVHASHGRAIEGVCKHLSDEANVARLLKKPFSPRAMQLVFAAALQREGAANRSINIRPLRQVTY